MIVSCDISSNGFAIQVPKYRGLSAAQKMVVDWRIYPKYEKMNFFQKIRFILTKDNSGKLTIFFILMLLTVFFETLGNIFARSTPVLSTRFL